MTIGGVPPNFHKPWLIQSHPGLTLTHLGTLVELHPQVGTLEASK
jgi:hypothetical protein